MENKEDTDCSFNDDEIFFGRLTLKEVKKRIFMDVNQKYLSRLASCDEKYNDGNDFKIIETSSQPNMLAANGDGDGLTEHLKSTSDPCFNRNKHNIDIHLKIRADPDCENRDSFLEMEEKVTEQCKYAYKCDNNLDNTLEFVDFILNHAQCQEKNIKATNIIEQESCENNKTCIKDDEAPMNESLSQSRAHNSQNDEKTYKEHDDNIEKLIHIPTTPIKCDQIETLSISKNLKPESASALNTPVSIKNQVSNVFKTPKIPLSSTKDSGAKKIPSRSKAYEHIVSPIATYIRNSPQVPLVKHVHPKKPLPSTSLIPKLLKNNPELKSDKENVVLPQLAYRNAKKTLVIDVNKEKLPQSNWAQKLTPMKPIVLKHNHREGGKIPLSLQQQQEDSFQDLTLHQADVSVCTQKLAFQK